MDIDCNLSIDYLKTSAAVMTHTIYLIQLLYNDKYFTTYSQFVFPVVRNNSAAIHLISTTTQ